MKEDFIVVTFDGTKAKRSDCRKIKDQFYIKNVQCFFIKDLWYRVNSGSIVFNHTTKEWVLKETPGLTKGIIGYDHLNEEVLVGYFIKDVFKNVNVEIGGTRYPCISYSILPQNKFYENVPTNTFNLLTDGVDPRRSSAIPNINFNNQDYGFALQYNMRHSDRELINTIETGFSQELKNNNFTSNHPLAGHVDDLKDLTFGFEFETVKGRIPACRLPECGLIPLRDGSITGIEYASVPLSGNIGLIGIEKMCAALQKYTAISTNESTHMHLGSFGIPKKNYKEFIARLYTIACVIEPEVYNMFPELYIKTSKFKGRGKDYNKPLEKGLVSADLSTTFDNLTLYLAGGRTYEGLGSQHPSDESDSHKWSIEQRYVWLNFIPALFGKTQTIEFRVHVPTQNPVKLINWLYICAAIVNYAKLPFEIDNSIKSLTLGKIMEKMYNYRAASYLKKYIEHRKDTSYNADPIGELEIKADRKFMINSIVY